MAAAKPTPLRPSRRSPIGRAAKSGAVLLAFGIVGGLADPCLGALFHEFRGTVETSTGFVNPLVLVGFNPQPEPPAHPPEPVMGDPTLPMFGWTNDANHYEIAFGFNLGGDVSFNPQPEPPADDGEVLFSLIVPGANPDTFNVLLDLTVEGTLLSDSWEIFIPPIPNYEGKAIGIAFDVTPPPTGALSAVDLAFGITDEETGDAMAFTYIPEPATLTLFALAGSVAGCRRCRGFEAR